MNNTVTVSIRELDIGFIASCISIYFSVIFIFIVLLCCCFSSSKNKDIVEKFKTTKHYVFTKKQPKKKKWCNGASKSKVNSLEKCDDKKTHSENPHRDVHIWFDTYGENNTYLYFKFDSISDLLHSYKYTNDPFEELKLFVDTIMETTDRNEIILLHISSSGGQAYKYEQAYTNLMRLRSAGFTVIALVDDIAASGGYMLACACNVIICSEYATIGSIGVIANVYNYNGLFDKIGLKEKTFTTGPYKQLFPSGEQYDHTDIEKMNSYLKETFDVFKEIVVKARPLTHEQATEIFTAKTWYGKKAMDIGLVDKIMTPNDYLDRLVLNGNTVYIVKKNENSSYLSNLSNILNQYNQFTNIINLLISVKRTKYYENTFI